MSSTEIRIFRAVNWNCSTAKVRIQLLPQSYLECEKKAVDTLKETLQRVEKKQ